MSHTVITPTSIAERCRSLEAFGFEYYLVATEANMRQFDLRPFGLDLKPVPVLGPNPYGWDTTAFIRLWHSMDTHVFAGRGLTMPNWVLVDHALLSSGLLIITCPPDRLDELGIEFGLTSDERFVLNSLRAEGADLGHPGPIPIASYCASPTADPVRRVGWSLCSVVPRSGVGFLAKALGLGAYRTTHLSGTTQYDNVALRVHTKFGPARMLSAVVDIHTAPHTLVYETDLTRWLRDEDPESSIPEPTELVSVTDTEKHAELQELLDAQTHELTILPPGIIVREAERFVPLLVRELDDPAGALA